jgi:hypothetical protein
MFITLVTYEKGVAGGLLWPSQGRYFAKKCQALRRKFQHTRGKGIESSHCYISSSIFNKTER